MSRRRPEDRSAALAYLAMSCLYKRSNRIRHFLIKHRLVAAAWRPLVEITRRRHLCFRRMLALLRETATLSGSVVSAGA